MKRNPGNIDFDNPKKNKNRFYMIGITEDNAKFYYVDDIVGWGCSKRHAMQVYGRRYAERYLRKILRNARVRVGGAVFARVKTYPVPKQYLNKKYYIENVRGDEKYFEQGRKLYKQYGNNVSLGKPKKH